VPGIIQVQRSQSLELVSLGLVASGMKLLELSPEQTRLIQLIGAQTWPYQVTDYFRQALPVARPYGLDYSLACCLVQAALFTQQPFESIELGAYLQAAERANLNRNWVNSKTQAWLGELPEMLRQLNGLSKIEPIQAAFAFAYQTNQIRYLETAESCLNLIQQFSRGNPCVTNLTLLPNPLQIPELSFISKGMNLFVELNEPSYEMVLRAYLHAALQPYRMQLLELSWRSGPGVVIDLSARALKGLAREESLEGTLHFMEVALVACLAVLLMPGTIQEKKQSLAKLEGSGYVAARVFGGMASFPVYEDEIPLYIRQLTRTV
jgi:hypothetical protein